MMNKELLRMQMLAGIITESQYKRKLNEDENLSPEQTAKIVSQNTSRFESDPALDRIANKIANDPKAAAELTNFILKANISLNEVDVDLDPTNVYQMALISAKKAETLNEGFDYAGAFWVGIVGGGALGRYLASLGDVITPHMERMGQSPSHMGATLAGGIAGAILLSLGKKVYELTKK
jgi:hypothetical protein